MNEDLRKFLQTDRRDFTGEPFDESVADKDPVRQFSTWFEQVLSQGLPDPYAFVLCTADQEGIPSGRVLYMRDLTQRGITFYTNYRSEKGRELSENARAACVFFWPQLQRQVRVSGHVQKLGADESDAYFMSRPRESRIGAWASDQSSVIPSREYIEGRYREYETKFEGIEVTRPPHWGGYLLSPVAFEFWQGRESRLHDRLLYEKQTGGEWKLARLSP